MFTIWTVLPASFVTRGKNGDHNGTTTSPLKKTKHEWGVKMANSLNIRSCRGTAEVFSLIMLLQTAEQVGKKKAMDCRVL